MAQPNKRERSFDSEGEPPAKRRSVTRQPSARGRKSFKICIFIAIKDEIDEFWKVFDPNADERPTMSFGAHGTGWEVVCPNMPEVSPLLVVKPSRPGPMYASNLMKAVFEKVDVSIAVQVGISGSGNADVRLNDVIVAYSVDDVLHESKLGTEKNVQHLPLASAEVGTQQDKANSVNDAGGQDGALKIKLAGNEIQCTADLYNKATGLEDSLPGKYKQWAEETQSRVLGFPIASSSGVIDNKGIKDAILGRNRKFGAVDTESHGFVDACVKCKESMRPIKFLILRAVQDSAAGNKAAEETQRMSQASSSATQSQAAHPEPDLPIRQKAMQAACKYLKLLLEYGFIYPRTAEQKLTEYKESVWLTSPHTRWRRQLTPGILGDNTAPFTMGDTRVIPKHSASPQVTFEQFKADLQLGEEEAMDIWRAAVRDNLSIGFEEFKKALPELNDAAIEAAWNEIVESKVATIKLGSNALRPKIQKRWEDIERKRAKFDELAFDAQLDDGGDDDAMAE